MVRQHCPQICSFSLTTVSRRWAFLLQMPILALSIILVILKANIPLTKKQSTFRQKLARIDWLGSATLVATIGALLVGVTLKTAEEMPWSSPLVWGLFVASALSGIAFFLVESYWSPEPILPMRLLHQRTPAAVAISNFGMAFCAFSVLYNVPLYFSAVRLQTASQAGLHLLPNSVSSTCSWSCLSH